MSGNAVVIMAKAPIPGQVKTRMIPSLEPHAASDLYLNFLLDKIEQVKNIEAHPFIAYTPKSALDLFRSLAPPGFFLIDQVGEDLGDRLANVSKMLFSQGFNKVVLLDSDTPNLPVEYIKKGFEFLDSIDIVLGPCEDGGYYLIGSRVSQPLLFDGIPWSTPAVTESTVKKAESSGLSILLLDTWYDIDTMEDLLRLKRDISTKERKDGFFCENTYREISLLNIG